MADEFQHQTFADVIRMLSARHAVPAAAVANQVRKFRPEPRRHILASPDLIQIMDKHIAAYAAHRANPTPQQRPTRRPPTSRKQKFTDEVIAIARDRVSRGELKATVARDLKISVSHLCRIIKNQRRITPGAASSPSVAA